MILIYFLFLCNYYIETTMFKLEQSVSFINSTNNQTKKEIFAINKKHNDLSDRFAQVDVKYGDYVRQQQQVELLLQQQKLHNLQEVIKHEADKDKDKDKEKKKDVHGGVIADTEATEVKDNIKTSIVKNTDADSETNNINRIIDVGAIATETPIDSFEASANSQKALLESLGQEKFDQQADLISRLQEQMQKQEKQLQQQQQITAQLMSMMNPQMTGQGLGLGMELGGGVPGMGQNMLSMGGLNGTGGLMMAPMGNLTVGMGIGMPVGSVGSVGSGGPGGPISAMGPVVTMPDVVASAMATLDNNTQDSSAATVTVPAPEVLRDQVSEVVPDSTSTRPSTVGSVTNIVAVADGLVLPESDASVAIAVDKTDKPAKKRKKVP